MPCSSQEIQNHLRQKEMELSKFWKENEVLSLILTAVFKRRFEVWGFSGNRFAQQMRTGTVTCGDNLSWSSRRAHVLLGVCCHLDFEELTSVKGCGRCKMSEDVTPQPVVSERMFAALSGMYGFLRLGGQGNWAVPSYPVFLLGDAGEAFMWRSCSCSEMLLGPLRSQGVLLLHGLHCFMLHPNRLWW